MDRVAMREARKQLPDIVNRVFYGGETIILSRQGKDMVAVVSLADLALLQKIEDMIDIEASREAMEEPGESISHEELGRELGFI